MKRILTYSAWVLYIKMRLSPKAQQSLSIPLMTEFNEPRTLATQRLISGSKKIIIYQESKSQKSCKIQKYFFCMRSVLFVRVTGYPEKDYRN